MKKKIIFNFSKINADMKYREYTKQQWDLQMAHEATIDRLEKEAHANAKLIAASPDLLEACKMVERAWTGDGVDMSKAVDLCLLAITKATR